MFWNHNFHIFKVCESCWKFVKICCKGNRSRRCVCLTKNFARKKLRHIKTKRNVIANHLGWSFTVALYLTIKMYLFILLQHSHADSRYGHLDIVNAWNSQSHLTTLSWTLRMQVTLDSLLPNISILLTPSRLLNFQSMLWLFNT